MDLTESYREELRLIRKPWTGAGIGLIVLALLVIPWLKMDYLVYMATVVFIYAIGVQGQNILIGYTGQISFGQAGFLAIGAYTFGHASALGIPLPLGLLAAGAMAGIFGVIVGFPSLRLKGPYLAIATMGFGIAIYQILLNSEVISGGRMGLMVKKLPALFGLTQQVTFYYFTLLLALIFTLISYNTISSYAGRAFIAIRDNDIAAEAMGVNLARYKLLSFGMSSFYLGATGGAFRPADRLSGAESLHLHGVGHGLCGGYHRRAGLHRRLHHGSGLCHSGAAGVRGDERTGPGHLRGHHPGDPDL